VAQEGLVTTGMETALRALVETQKEALGAYRAAYAHSKEYIDALNVHVALLNENRASLGQVVRVLAGLLENIDELPGMRREIESGMSTLSQ
jgi:hypothetical protein